MKDLRTKLVEIRDEAREVRGEKDPDPAKYNGHSFCDGAVVSFESALTLLDEATARLRDKIALVKMIRPVGCSDSERAMWDGAIDKVLALLPDKQPDSKDG